ncbi:MAG TPA: Ig-like domain-containing protein [Gemmatimonadales bacterium]|nr:Ig-like domain-containing protein [Gemmatimonadales bacterium]
MRRSSAAAGRPDCYDGNKATGTRWYAFTALLPICPAALLACARIEPPPGGPPDPEPPRLVATRPDSFQRLTRFNGVAEFQFDEVVSEGGSPNRGEGTGGLEKLVILSPSTQVPEVDWRRSRITVRPREGWQANRVYRVELLPGVTDLRSNRSDAGAVITFSTGAPRPQTILTGQVLDWSTSRPAPGALVIASLLPDSLPYRGVADSNGRFSLGPLPQGNYNVSGVLDQDGDHSQDPREAYGSARVPSGKGSAGELWAFVHDTTPPRIQTVTADDSLKATITFSQKLDPRQRLGTKDVTLRLLPDSTAVPVSSILPQPVDDSLYAAKTPVVRDSAPALDSLARPDTNRRARRPQAPRRPGVAAGPKPSRPPLYDRLVLRVPKPWRPGSRLVVEVRGVRNVTGVAANTTGVLAVPEPPKREPIDTAGARRPVQGARPRTPQDSLARMPKDTLGAGRKPAGPPVRKR